MRRVLHRRTLARRAPSAAPAPPRRRSPAPGDACPRPDCGGRLTVYHTHTDATHRTRYLECDRCGAKPPHNKQIVPLEFAPPRRRAARD